jgi:hypothetical protein
LACPKDFVDLRVESQQAKYWAQQVFMGHPAPQNIKNGGSLD